MRPLDFILAVLVAVIWGGNFIAVKYGLSHFPPLFITALRFALVAPCLLPFHRRLPVPLASMVKLSLVLGVLHFGLVFTGMKMGLNVGSVILAAQMAVPFSCLLGALLFGDRLGRWQMLGMAVAFIGLYRLTGTPDVVERPLALVFVVCGACAWGYSNLMIKQWGGVPIFAVLGWMSLFSLPMMLLLSYIVEGNQWPLLLTVTWDVAASVIFTGIGSTVIGYGFWYYLIQRYPITMIAPFQLLVPVTGVGMAVAWFHEPVSSHLLTGGILTVLGVAIIVMRRPKLLERGEGTI